MDHINYSPFRRLINPDKQSFVWPKERSKKVFCLVSNQLFEDAVGRRGRQRLVVDVQRRRLGAILRAEVVHGVLDDAVQRPDARRRAHRAVRERTLVP